jgi:UDP-N-acetylmuramate--alanine ligase
VVMDDYGHHPTEIRATLEAARDCGYARIHVLFQPHRYTRTRALMDDFARAFHQADAVFVTDIYAASEAPIEEVSGEILAERMREFGHRNAQWVGTLEAGIEAVAAAAEPGDLVLTLGAGSVWQGGRPHPGLPAGGELSGAAPRGQCSARQRAWLAPVP